MSKTESTTLSSLWARSDRVSYRDRQQLRRRLRGVDKITGTESQQAVIAKIEQDVIAAEQRLIAHDAGRPATIHFPDNLPVSQKQQTIADAIAKHQVVIIAGETGSGKTTQIPKICLALGRGRQGLIGHTQPRRLAARTVATRIAEELGTTLGGVVGYRVRFTDQISDQTHIKLMTDGILLAEIQQDKRLLQYDTIIIDEAHERSLNIDFLLGYLRELLPKRPDLKVIITSATIDPERFSKHFDGAPIIEVSGRTYPVEIRYRPVSNDSSEGDRDQLQAIFDAVDELYREPPGDILIFMSGEREIRDTADALSRQGLPHTEVLPLYARLSNSEQNRVFQTHTGRRIVLATNVAETSLTVPGIKYVIDPGTARISRYSYRTKVQRLPIEPISQASANQRAGRCGRVSEGICIRLYGEDDYLSRPEFTDPEILRTNLASVILQMTALGLGNIQHFPFVEKPDNRNIQDGVRLLEELGAVENASNNIQKLTTSGRQLAQLPIDPRLAKMVLSAQQFGCVREAMIITAALSIQDPRERPADRQQASDEKHRRFADKESDFLAWVNLWNYIQDQQKTLTGNQFRRQCKSDYLNYLRIREWQDIYTQLRQVVRELGFSLNSEPAPYRELHSALLSGLLSRVGQKEIEKGEFMGSRQTRFHLFPASSLFKKTPKWVMVAELVETSKLWGRIAAKIEPEWIEPLAGHLVKYSYSEPHWEKKQGAVFAFEKVTLYGLPIVTQRKVNYSKIDSAICRELFIRHALVEGEWQTRHRFFSHNQNLRLEVEDLEHKSRRRDILVDDETLFAFYDQRLPDNIVSVRHFDKWWKTAFQQDPHQLDFDKTMLVREGAGTIDANDYPNTWRQGNLQLPLTYQFEPGKDADGVTVHIPLPLLNQVTEQGFDWQIPGLRKTLIVALIKSLPKPIRRNFVPAPDYADAFLGRVTDFSLPLLECLEREFRRMSGVTIERDAWQLAQVPDHLKMTFRIVDGNKKTLQESKSLTELQQQLKGKVRETLSKVADVGLEKQGVTEWDFGELPQTFSRNQAGFTLKAWPALVDEKQSVAIKLFDTEAEQQQAMWQGQRRLLLLNIPSPIKYLHEKLPNKAKLGLYFNPYGQVLQLIDDCIHCGIDKIMTQEGGLVWDEQHFMALREKVKADLNQTVVEIAQQVEQILSTVFAINKRLKGRVDMALALALSDIKAQLSNLVYPGFVTQNGWQKLADTLRYLQGIERRLDKLPVDPHSDRARMLRVQHVEQSLQRYRNKLPKAEQHNDKVMAARWMVEELRISLFAQQLGTPYPVSEKRIIQLLEESPS